MDLTPAQVSGASFATVRKGYDPTQVDEFLAQAAMALESAQQQATAMEARARAAVARLQEVVTAAPAPAPAPPPAEPLPAREPIATPTPIAEPKPAGDEFRVGTVEAETISRTLVLAQRTADSTVAEALSEAERIRSEAQSEAEATIDSTRDISARLLDDARTEARRVTETERRAAADEVQNLNSRRDSLVGDVDQLEEFLADQRERLRGAARQIEALCERVPSGLAPVSRPALSDDASEADRDAPDDDAIHGELDETVELTRPLGREGFTWAVQTDELHHELHDELGDELDDELDDDAAAEMPRLDLTDQAFPDDEGDTSVDLPTQHGGDRVD